MKKDQQKPYGNLVEHTPWHSMKYVMANQGNYILNACRYRRSMRINQLWDKKQSHQKFVDLVL